MAQMYQWVVDLGWTSTDSSITFSFRGNSYFNATLTATLKRNGSTVSSQTATINKNAIGYVTFGGLAADTSYTLTYSVDDGSSGSEVAKTAPTGGSGGSGSAGGDPWYLGTGTPGYPSVTGAIGPYPIDGNNYTGQNGTAIKIGWTSTSNYGHYWAKINGTGNLLLTDSTSNPYTGTYDGNHHGTGDYVSITLEGDAGFTNCSTVSWSVGEIATDTGWGYWSPDGVSGWPPSHVGSGGLLKRVGGGYSSSSGGWYVGPASGYTNDHAASGQGRGTHTIILPRPETVVDEGSNGKIYTYYCKEGLGDGAYARDNTTGATSFGAIHGKGSIAAIKFEVPRLDPNISIFKIGDGTAYYNIADGFDTTTGEYTYDTTQRTNRYIPLGSHIKIYAQTLSGATFYGITNVDNVMLDYVDNGGGLYTLEADVTDDFIYVVKFAPGSYYEPANWDPSYAESYAYVKTDSDTWSKADVYIGNGDCAYRELKWSPADVYVG